MAKQGKRQFRLAETEKYPHVTFFLNGGKEAPEEGEDRYMPKSPKVATYDLQPEMSAPEVTEKFVGDRGGYDLIVTNYANPDMVSPAGDLKAAMAACAAVDQEPAGRGRAGEGRRRHDRHRRSRQLRTDAGPGDRRRAYGPYHQSRACRAGGWPGRAALKNGRLADLAPTILDLMGLENPQK